MFSVHFLSIVLNVKPSILSWHVSFLGGGLCYTTVQETALEKLEAIGLDKRQYRLHSLRAGGASAAANKGVPDLCLRDMGAGTVKML